VITSCKKEESAEAPILEAQGDSEYDIKIPQDIRDRYSGVQNIRLTISVHGDACSVDESAIYDHVEGLDLSNITVSKDQKSNNDISMTVGFIALQTENKKCAVTSIVLLFSKVKTTHMPHNPNYSVDETLLGEWFTMSIVDAKDMEQHAFEKAETVLKYVDSYTAK